MKYEVTVTRDATLILRYAVVASSAVVAEAVVQTAIDTNQLSVLGKPLSEEYRDDEESDFYVIDTEEMPHQYDNDNKLK